MFGGFFLSYNYIQTMKISTFDLMSNAIYKETEDGAVIETEPASSDSNENVEIEKKEPEPEEKKEYKESTITEKYKGYLSIPKINLKKGFFAMESAQNNVEKNIFVVSGSSYPDVENGNLIIAGHSGTGWKAFFNDLHKLGEGDEAIVSYNDKNYVYKITKIYKQNKTGTIAIYRNYDKTTLTLITCTNYDSKTQTIYIAELVEVR